MTNWKQVDEDLEPVANGLIFIGKVVAVFAIGSLTIYAAYNIGLMLLAANPYKVLGNTLIFAGLLAVVLWASRYDKHEE